MSDFSFALKSKQKPKLIKNQKIIEKERTINAPEGCEIEKVELIDGVAVVTFREKERKLPKSWEEFCEMFPIKKGECSIDTWSQIMVAKCELDRSNRRDIITFPDRSTAEAVLALCQLIQLRNCYNGDWVPDWTEWGRNKYVIDIVDGDIEPDEYNIEPTILYFKTADLRDEFLCYFRPLIEKLKPLYGIKEGGQND